MDHTYLGLGLREHVLDGIGKAVQVVSGGNEQVLYAPSLDIGQYGHPKGSGFVLAQPQPQNLLFTVPAKTNGDVHGLVDDLGVLPYLKDDAVHPGDQVYGFQRPVLPCYDVIGHLVRNTRYGGCGNIKAVNLPDLLFYVRLLMPLAYRPMMTFSIPSTILVRLGTSIGLKEASLSLGTFYVRLAQ